jgi:hypothetical protein
MVDFKDILTTETDGGVPNGKWAKAQFITPKLTPLEKLNDLIDDIKKLLTLAVEWLEFYLNLVTTINNPLAAVIQQLIDELNAFLDSFLQDAGIYVLVVPLPRSFFPANDKDINPPNSMATELNYVETETPLVGYQVKDAEALPQDPQEPLAAYGENFISQGIRQGRFLQSTLNSSLYNAFMGEVQRKKNGNFGFYRTVVRSLQDRGDLQRPLFWDDDDYVAGMVMVAGWEDSIEAFWIMKDLWSTFSGFPHVSPYPEVPKPRDLKVNVLRTKKNVEFDALLSWKTHGVPLYYAGDAFQTMLIPDRIAIIRGTYVEMMNARNVQDIFGTEELREGLTNIQGNAKVIKEGEYRNVMTTYLDQEVEATQDDTFYYAISWKFKAFGVKDVDFEEPVDVDYFYISNVVRVVPYVSTSASTPPDWFRTPSLGDLIPPLSQLTNFISAIIESILSNLSNLSTGLQEYVDFLKDEIKRYETWINNILGLIQQINAILALPKSAGIYARRFSGYGGNHFFMADLAKSLTRNYPNAPPFHKGTEMVIGMVLMAGGKTRADVSKLEAYIDLLLGLPNPKRDKIIEDMEEVIDGADDIEDEVVDDAEGPDLGQLPVNCSKTSNVNIPEFGNDMKVVE